MKISRIFLLATFSFVSFFLSAFVGYETESKTPGVIEFIGDAGSPNVMRFAKWEITQAAWRAELLLESDSVVVRYLKVGDTGEDIQRGFKYSLSRQDLEDAIFAGP